jgi:addiction module HigA family antidote
MKGDRKGQWAVWVSGNWRLVFGFEGSDATNIELVDYHRARKGDTMQMQNPSHPGEIIREDCLKPLGLTVTAAAKGLGVTRKTLSDLLNGHSGVSPDMAIRLEKAGWSTADTWLRMQMTRNLFEARQHADKIEVKGFDRAPS